MMVLLESEYGWYMIDSCCTCYLCSALVSVIYYLYVVDRTNLVMLMMMEGPERGLAYAIETPTILWGRL